MSAATKLVTVITMWRGHDAETFVRAVDGKVSHSQRCEWRKAHNCDQYYDGPEDDLNNMCFREMEVLPNEDVYEPWNNDLLNIDGGDWAEANQLREQLNESA